MPDEIGVLLGDPHLFASSTTKDILRRFHELQGRPMPPASEFKEVYNKQDNSTRPPPRRVDTDPALWQQEHSVRPIQEPPAVYTGPGAMASAASAAYAQHKLDRSNSQLAPEQQRQQQQQDMQVQGREWRHSGSNWGGQGVAMGHN